MTAFTDTERGSIAHHLRVAAERYDEDAKTMRESTLPADAAGKLAQQFESQAVEAREFADRIER